MKKVLIYLENDLLKPQGGPYAVGYVLNESLKTMQQDSMSISFLNNDNSSREKIKTSWFGKRKFLVKLYRIFRNYKRYNCILRERGYTKTEINEYDIIHFHKTSDMYAARYALQDYKGIVILTSHSPVPLSQEIYDSLSKFEKTFFKGLYKNLPQIDEYAFRRADIIHFPCPQAEESYEKHMPGYAGIKEEKKSNYFYLPTGILPCIPKRDREVVRDSLGLSEKDFVMCYVGRHNEVKGYGKLKEMGKTLLNEDDNTWMLVAGREEPIKRYEHKNWIEVGFTDDAYSYISASDVFVLPNIETYFDIVMLEVLSLGKIIVASKTGGNKFFEGRSNGIFLYETLSDAVSMIHAIKGMTEQERKKLGNENKKLFDENFTGDVFTQKYVKFLESL